MRRGNSPMMSSRLPVQYRDKLDQIALWLHETRGLPLSRRTALEYMIETVYHGEFHDEINQDRSDKRTA